MFVLKIHKMIQMVMNPVIVMIYVKVMITQVILIKMVYVMIVMPVLKMH